MLGILLCSEELSMTYVSYSSHKLSLWAERSDLNPESTVLSLHSFGFQLEQTPEGGCEVTGVTSIFAALAVC